MFTATSLPAYTTDFSYIDFRKTEKKYLRLSDLYLLLTLSLKWSAHNFTFDQTLAKYRLRNSKIRLSAYLHYLMKYLNFDI